MGSKSAKQQVVDYRMSLHLGICTGPVDALLGVWVGEKSALSTAASTPTVFNVTRLDLFGDVKKEGGVMGAIHYLPGGASQILTTFLAGKLGRTALTCPAFRGIASLFFTEHVISSNLTGGSTYTLVAVHPRVFRERKGFFWTSNSPYLRAIWAQVTRCPKLWYPEKAVIHNGLSGRASVYIAVDASGSMDIIDSGSPASRLSVVKSALDTVLARVESAVAAGGVDLDIAVNFWSFTSTQTSYTHMTSSQATALRTWVAARVTTGGTYFNVAATGAKAWFDASAADSTIQRRIFVFLTDGEPGDSSDTAAATIADMLSRDGGTYNTAAGTAVDCYGMNIVLGVTTHTAKLDNTPEDGVPVITSADPAPLVAAVENALFTGGWPDSNPAHMIHECLTNSDWGMGTSSTALDLTAFTAAADTLHAEGLGLSMIWTRQAAIEDFVTEILNHINGTLFVNPATGLITLKLIRDDYDVDDLPVVSVDNAEFSNFQRRSPAETVNEIIVTWTSPVTEQDETVTIQDLGGIAVQGAIISDGRNYYGVRSRNLAAQLAARDIATASAPLASCDADVNRYAWDFVPGGCVKLVSPDDGFDELIMRIQQVDYGRPGEPTIKLSLLEDIFTLPVPAYEVPPESAWVDPSEDPAPAAYAELFTLPYFMANMLVDSTALAGAAYPDVFVGVLVAQTGTDTDTYELIGPDVDPAGNVVMDGAGTKDIASRATLTGALTAEAVSGMEFTGTTQGSGPLIGGFVLIGESAATEGTAEIGLITGFVDPLWTVSRGVLDTVPRAWAAGTSVWFIKNGMRVQDDTAQSALQTVDYQMLTITSKGILAQTSAPLVTETLTERPHLPLRPADVKAGGVAFGTYDASIVDPVPITWSNRNRLLENSLVLGWTDAGVTPEAGQTTRIKIYDYYTGVLVGTTSGLTGSSYDLPHSAFSGSTIGVVRVFAVRDGFESLQGHEVTVIVQAGYGYNYGMRYGQ
jgi:hypothetical protein